MSDPKEVKKPETPERQEEKKPENQPKPRLTEAQQLMINGV